MTGKELETAKAVAAAFAATERSKRFNEMLSSVNLPSGGIVSGPSELIGEAGPEAIIPLSQMGSMGGGVTVNVTGGLATSAEIGQAVVNAIRAYNRSAGPAQIQVA